MAQRIIAYDDTNERLVRTTKDPADIGASSSTGETVDAGSQAVANGATSQAITYTNAFSNTLYGVVAQMVNTVDASVQYQPLTITAKSTTGCTVSWNTPTDSANYVIDFIAADPCITYRGGDVATPSSTTSKNVNTLYPPGTYAFVSQFRNTVDASPLFQPTTWSIQDTTTDAALMQSTIRGAWNTPLDDSNYRLDLLGNQANCSTIASFITSVSNGVTSLNVSFPFFNLESANYAVIGRFVNLEETEASIIYQPITITSKVASGFSAKWNTPTDSVDYKIEWLCNIHST